MSIKGPKVSKFEWTKAAQRDLKELPDHIQADFNALRKEMCVGQYTPGRQLKQRKGNRKNQPKIWQARLSQSYRLTFTFDDGVARFRRIGPHKIFD